MICLIKIIYISDQSANIKLKEDAEVAINLMNLHLIFEDSDKTILGEVDDLTDGVVKARFLGEIVNGRYNRWCFKKTFS